MLSRFFAPGSMLRFSAFCALGVILAFVAGRVFNAPPDVSQEAFYEIGVLELIDAYEPVMWDAETAEIVVVGSCGALTAVGEQDIEVIDGRLAVVVAGSFIEPLAEEVDAALC